jgi:ribosome maturation factor RimP
MKRHIALETVIDPIVVGLGYELVGLEYLSQGKHSILRIYIDRPEGVAIDDCEKVSRQVGSVLEVESDLVRGEYTLEVSSPGVDRKIFTLEQFPKFLGRKVHLTVHTLVNGQRNLKGTLSAVNDAELLLDINGTVINVDVANIAQANVIDEKARL